jgi:hypothetical protein
MKYLICNDNNFINFNHNFNFFINGYFFESYIYSTNFNGD